MASLSVYRYLSFSCMAGLYFSYQKRVGLFLPYTISPNRQPSIVVSLSHPGSPWTPARWLPRTAEALPKILVSVPPPPQGPVAFVKYNATRIRLDGAGALIRPSISLFVVPSVCHAGPTRHALELGPLWRATSPARPVWLLTYIALWWYTNTYRSAFEEDPR